MSTDLVPFEQLQELADRKHAEEVIAWLKREGWTYSVSAIGRPKVDRREWDRHMLGAKVPQRKGPNLGWYGSKTTAP